ncbi:MAG: hypothetical protein ABII75_08350, partial [Candidatus Omnitrophota bacterium]
QTLRRLTKSLIQKRGIEKNLFIKKFIKNIIYSSSQIQITLYFSKDYENFAFSFFGGGEQKNREKIRSEFSPVEPDLLVRDNKIGSPKWLERRTFSFTIILETKATPIIKPQRKYRNPIYLAKQYKLMIESGQARNESDLARQIGVSRVTVNHFVSLLKLTPEVIQTVEQMGDPMPKRYITERKLRCLVKEPKEKQLKALSIEKIGI